jgi:circadian clock protein KaiC
MTNAIQTTATIHKSLTGIEGLDDITNGGLPTGRPTLIAGNAGCGKTLFAMEFIINGVTKYNEPGVFISFEEPKDDLIQNVSSLGYDLKKLLKEKNLVLIMLKLSARKLRRLGSTI